MSNDKWGDTFPIVVPINEYPKKRKINFPKEILISFAVCCKECGNAEFIVDGQTQVCQYCGTLMFRLSSKKYIIAE